MKVGAKYALFLRNMRSISMENLFRMRFSCAEHAERNIESGFNLFRLCRNCFVYLLDVLRRSFTLEESIVLCRMCRMCRFKMRQQAINEAFLLSNQERGAAFSKAGYFLC